MLLLKRIFKFQKRKKTVIFAVKKRKPVLPHSVQIFDLGKYLWASREKRQMEKNFFEKKTASRNAVNCNISTQSIPLDRNDDDDDDDAKHWLKLHLLLERILTLKHKINGILEYFFKISDKFIAYFLPFTFKSTLIIKWRNTKNIRNFTCFSMLCVLLIKW